MKYFQTFPRIDYTTTEIINGNPQTILRNIPNMTVRFDTTYQIGDYEWYRIQEHDRPDTVAAQWYGSSRYTWVVLLSNNMRDLYDWPMNQLEFYEYMSRKYETSPGARDGVAESASTIYHYLWKDPVSQLELVVDATLYATLPVNEKRSISVYDHESMLNDKRHDIKKLTQATFTSFVRQFTELMGSF